MSLVKKPCKHCPFRNDIKPFLHPDRAAEIAYAASNPYSDFPCHKTIDYTDEEDFLGEQIVDMQHSQTCAGFLTLRAQSGEDVPEGFEPSWDICFTDEWEMIQANEDEWNKKD
jgi:hypothetical protein